jgi:small subunit ribosomal protein S4e
MAHLKRNKIEKFWAVPRKGTKYLARAPHNQKESIPLVVVVRDILKLVRNKKELQRLINEKRILINQKQVRESSFPVGLFDVINLPDIKNNYKASLSESKKMIFEEISDKEAESRVYKVMDKKIVRGKKIQLNLSGGLNLISDEKVNMGDSVVLNLKDRKIAKIIPMAKGQEGFVIKGKHMGVQGKIDNIMERGGKQLAKILSKDGKINVWVKNVVVIE